MSVTQMILDLIGLKILTMISGICAADDRRSGSTRPCHRERVSLEIFDVQVKPLLQFSTN